MANSSTTYMNLLIVHPKALSNYNSNISSLLPTWKCNPLLTNQKLTSALTIAKLIPLTETNYTETANFPLAPITWTKNPVYKR